MIKKEIYDFIFEYTEKEDKKSEFIEYLAVMGKDQIIMVDEFNGGYDCRLNSDEYLHNSLTLIARSRENGFIIGKGTVFITEYKTYRNTFFWQKNHDRFNSLAMQFVQRGYSDIKIRLSKKKLGVYQDVIGNICVILGFTQIANSIRFSSDIFDQYKATRFYLNLIKRIIHDYKIFIFTEPCGICNIEESLLSGDYLDISGRAIKGLGQVNPESIVSFKLARKVGMSLMEGLYHGSTLGPIFFSKIS